MSTAAAPAVGLFKAHDAVYQEAYEGRQFDAVYFGMLIFACLIALMGLLLNSPAVIIGAMLISPLMGPILACGLALTTAEWSLGKKAGRNVALSVAEVVLIAFIATQLSPLRQATPEILARTNPNLMDLLIAFFSGLAGTVALTSRKTAFTILPGVAIATAVMPPLATVGYGLGTGQWAVARGAFMLFFTNFTAIVLSASLVFLLIGLRPQVERMGERHPLIRWRIAIAAAVLVLISIPLMRTLIRAATQANLRGQVQETLRRAVQLPDGSRRLDSVSVELLRRQVIVNASIRTTQYMEPAEIEKLQAAIAGRIARPVRLEVQQLQIAQKTASTEQVIRDFLAAGLIRPAPVEQPLTATAQLDRLEERLAGPLRALVGAAGVTLGVDSIGKASDGTVVINASAQARQFTSADMWSVAAAALAKEVSAPVKINATVAVTGAALQLSYRGSRDGISAAQLRQVRQFRASLGKNAGLAFKAAPGETTALAARRIARLRQLLPPPVAEANWEAPANANTITVVPVQNFAAESQTAGGKPGPQRQ